MKTLKRFSTSVTSSFDWLVSQVENHDAVIASTIKDMQEAVVKAKVKYKKVLRDGENLKNKISELKRKEEIWKQRALEFRESDREQALECLARQKRCTSEIEHYEAELKKHKQFEAQFKKDLSTATERIEALQRKRNNMQAREHRADALRLSEEPSLEMISEVDEIFDRWEVKIARSECLTEDIDTFEHDLIKAEELKDLEAELDNLEV